MKSRKVQRNGMAGNKRNNYNVSFYQFNQQKTYRYNPSTITIERYHDLGRLWFKINNLQNINLENVVENLKF